MPEEKQCPFCLMEEMQGERILERGPRCWVILSDPYLVPCHILVVPRIHVAAFAELYANVQVFQDVAHALALWSKHIKVVLSKAWGVQVGCDITQHDRGFLAFDGISVPEHLHFHIRPRTLCDELYEQVQRHETPMFQRQKLEGGKLLEMRALLGR